MVDLYKIGLPSGKHLHSYGKSPLLMGKLTISRENLHFPMVFLWFSYGFPMVFLRIPWFHPTDDW